jgi:excinuclease UvrABC nuclease subunit
MHTAAAELHFELAARLRDEVSELKKELRGMRAAERADACSGEPSGGVSALRRSGPALGG